MGTKPRARGSDSGMKCRDTKVLCLQRLSTWYAGYGTVSTITSPILCVMFLVYLSVVGGEISEELPGRGICPRRLASTQRLTGAGNRKQLISTFWPPDHKCHE